jgi:hypothetical protein
MASLAGIRFSSAFEDITFYHENEYISVDFVLFNPKFNERDGKRSIAYDPSIVNPFSSNFPIHKFIKDPFCILDTTSTTKKEKYEKVCAEAGYRFYPLAINAYGNVSMDVSNLIKQLAYQYSDNSGIPVSVALQEFRIDFIITLYRATVNVYMDFIRKRNLFLIQSVNNTMTNNTSPTDNVIDQTNLVHNFSSSPSNSNSIVVAPNSIANHSIPVVSTTSVPAPMSHVL